MLRLIQIELLKLKNAPVVWMSLLGVVLVPLLNAFILLVIAPQQNLSEPVAWWQYNSQNTTFMGALIGTMLFGLIATYVFAREFVENTAKNVLTTPVQRSSFVFAKLMIVAGWLVALGIISYALAAFIGALMGLEAMSIKEVIARFPHFLGIIGLHYLNLPLVAWIALLSRSYIAPMAFSGGMTVIGLLMLNSGLHDFFPWSIPGALAMSTTNPSLQITGISLTIMFATFLVGVFLNIWYIYRTDIH